MIYYYKGIPVNKVIGQSFEYLLNVKDDDGNIYTIPYEDLKCVGDPISEPSLSSPSEVLYQEIPIIPLIEKTVEEKKKEENLPTKDKEAVKELEKALKETESKQSLVYFYVNKFTETEISSLSRNLPGIGKVTLRRVLENRPKSGYKDIKELSELNTETRVKWDHLEIDIIF